MWFIDTTSRIALACALTCAGSMLQVKADAFVDVTARSGLNFVHDNDADGRLLFPEITGPGAALFDYDMDGDLDLWLVQGGPLGRDGDAPSDRLFRNDLDDGEVSFVDITASAGIVAKGYGMAVATADYDQDGDVDVLVSNYGRNELWQNQGDGRFSEIGASAGLQGEHWSTGATFADIDGDGWLDLYITNYVDYNLAKPPRCFADSSRQDYCGPSAFVPQADQIYRNIDGQRFELQMNWLVDAPNGAGLGVVAEDFDADGWIDLYVANDGAANHLLLNQQGKRLVNDAWFRGVAVNQSGQPEASMGIAVADFDNDADSDLFLTHLMGESSTLYVNDGEALFEDQSQRSGLGDSSRRYTGWGTGFIDYDLDGWLDLVSFNGAVRNDPVQAAAGIDYPLNQRNQLYRNERGRFVEVERDSTAFAPVESSRGAAFGDINNDGAVDMVVTNSRGPARILLNAHAERGQWIGLDLRSSGRVALGSRVFIKRDNQTRSVWTVRRDGSYASANDPRIVAGLGNMTGPVEINIVWPDASQQSLSLTTNRYHLVEQTKQPE
ncbi:MAG: hypothetical protein DHS20C11_26410 [Lysobacteraceae bacterium]|nr:MAG: hypothetical protein DHS20C11_26410 [Xanthomonadaceae bacterium]